MYTYYSFSVFISIFTNIYTQRYIILYHTMYYLDNNLVIIILSWFVMYHQPRGQSSRMQYKQSKFQTLHRIRIECGEKVVSSRCDSEIQQLHFFQHWSLVYLDFAWPYAIAAWLTLTFPGSFEPLAMLHWQCSRTGRTAVNKSCVNMWSFGLLWQLLAILHHGSGYLSHHVGQVRSPPAGV